MLTNRLIFATCALWGATSAMGCVIVDDGEGPNARGQFDVAWKVDGLDADFGDGCLEIPDADSVVVVSEPVGGGDIYEDVYNCEDGSGVTATLPLGDYDVWANVRDGEERLLAQTQVVPASLDHDGHLNVVGEELAFLNAEFEATWQLTEETSDDPLSCYEVVSGGLSLLSTHVGSGGTGFDDVYECPEDATSGDFQSDPLPLGDYTVSLSLLEEGTEDVVRQEERNETLEEHATVVDLGTFEFLFPLAEGGRFDVIWKVEGRDDQSGDGCLELPDGDAVEVVSERISDGEQFIDIYDCEAGAGLTAELALDDYDVWMNVVDDQDRLLASSEVVEAAIDSTRPPVELPEFTFFSGQFDVDWELYENDGTSTDCREGEGVSILSTLADSGGTGFDDIFDCVEPDAVTNPMPLGDYTIAATLLDDQDEGIGSAEDLRDASLVEHATVEILETFEIVLD